MYPVNVYLGALVTTFGVDVINGEADYFNIQYGTSYGGNDSYTSSNTEAYTTSGEGYYNVDITYNYKYMNGGATESFEYALSSLAKQNHPSGGSGYEIQYSDADSRYVN